MSSSAELAQFEPVTSDSLPRGLGSAALRATTPNPLPQDQRVMEILLSVLLCLVLVLPEDEISTLERKGWEW